MTRISRGSEILKIHRLSRASCDMCPDTDACRKALQRSCGTQHRYVYVSTHVSPTTWNPSDWEAPTPSYQAKMLCLPSLASCLRSEFPFRELMRRTSRQREPCMRDKPCQEGESCNLGRLVFFNKHNNNPNNNLNPQIPKSIRYTHVPCSNVLTVIAQTHHQAPCKNAILMELELAFWILNAYWQIIGMHEFGR